VEQENFEILPDNLEDKQFPGRYAKDNKNIYFV